ncbi:hypothetical protein B0186_03225 [Canicola haemoglobinophilus]|nr:hypothetical protein [Canicola haemoglobinophilus]OOS01569.1 hypothetical protein B0186_03225 [Canicola haemoglobinophilus]
MNKINSSEKRTMFNVNQQNKRINTAECQDIDDWYLDGFRIGKSFPEYKQKMLQQRIAFCENFTAMKVSNTLINSWEDGFNNNKSNRIK